MAGQANTVSAHFLAKGIVITAGETHLTIKNIEGQVFQFDKTLPALNNRILEAARESVQGEVSLKADKPYTPVKSQLLKLGVDQESIPAQLLKQLLLLKEKTDEVTETTRDFGESFEGITVGAAGTYVRVTTTDPDEIADLSTHYPEGVATEYDDEILFIYGQYRGAAAGACPPINKGLFQLPEPRYGSECGASSIQGDVPEEGDFDGLTAAEAGETLSAKEKAAREVFNEWCATQRFGDRFTINSCGEFNNPSVMHQFSTGRFRECSSQANAYLFKLVRGKLTTQLLDAAELHGGSISALRAMCLCMKRSKTNARPNWNLFLRLVENALPQCLTYVGGRFVLKTADVAIDECELGDDFDI